MLLSLLPVRVTGEEPALQREHRAEEPTASAIDSQSVKTTSQGGPHGCAAGKKVKGRKRHLATDVLGLLLAVSMDAANIPDRDSATPLVDRLLIQHQAIRCLFVDAAYAGESARGVAARYGMDIEISRNLNDCGVPPLIAGTPIRVATAIASTVAVPTKSATTTQGFVPFRKRWVVERTHAWTDPFRLVSKDYNRRLDVPEGWIWFVHGRVLARRSARPV